jgi:hypothetical protein
VKAKENHNVTPLNEYNIFTPISILFFMVEIIVNDNFSLFHQNSMTSAPIIKNKNKNINMEDQILNQKLNLEIIST